MKWPWSKSPGPPPADTDRALIEMKRLSENPRAYIGCRAETPQGLSDSARRVFGPLPSRVARVLEILAELEPAAALRRAAEEFELSDYAIRDDNWFLGLLRGTRALGFVKKIRPLAPETFGYLCCGWQQRTSFDDDLICVGLVAGESNLKEYERQSTALPSYCRDVLLVADHVSFDGLGTPSGILGRKMHRTWQLDEMKNVRGSEFDAVATEMSACVPFFADGFGNSLWFRAGNGNERVYRFCHEEPALQPVAQCFPDWVRAYLKPDQRMMIIDDMA
jgi:hypothetical protein